MKFVDDDDDDDDVGCSTGSYCIMGWARFNVPLDTFLGHFGDGLLHQHLLWQQIIPNTVHTYSMIQFQILLHAAEL